MRQRVCQLVSGLAVLWTVLYGPWAMAQPYPGFGGSTRGGTGQPIYRVTNLSDAGPGSLRDAVSQGNRRVVFDVAGEIQLSRDLYVRGAFVTIDGSTAPPPRITLRNHGLLIHGKDGAHDVIVQGIRVRDSQGCDTCPTSGAGLGISRNAYNVVLDHVSVQGAGDQAIGIGKGAHDISVQWSIFAEGAQKNLPVLIGYRAQHISFHHNLIIKGTERMPQLMWSHDGDQAPDTQVDLRNNLLWDWKNMATHVWKGTRANIVGNYYYSPNSSEVARRRAIFMCHQGSIPPQCDGTNPRWFGRAYIADNVSGHGPQITAYLNGLGTEASPFPAPPVETTEACTAAQQVLASAGVRPLDAVDQRYIGEVSLVGCTTVRAPARH
jgi:pectate lyase